MNKYQSALDRIRYDVPFFNRHFDTLQELVDKSKPEKIVRTREGYECPECKNYFDLYMGGMNEMNYCPCCGQALRWKDE